MKTKPMNTDEERLARGMTMLEKLEGVEMTPNDEKIIVPLFQRLSSVLNDFTAFSDPCAMAMLEMAKDLVQGCIDSFQAGIAQSKN